MFAEAIEQILDTVCTPAAIRAIEAGADAGALGGALDQAGFFGLLAPEDAGGGGAGWPDFYEVVALCGARAVPIPLPQTLAARLLVHDVQALPAGLLTFAPSLQRQADGSLRADQVPCGRVAGHVLAADGDTLLLLPVAGAEQLPGGVHGSLAASLRWRAGAGRALAGPVAARDLQPLAALLHAGLLAGAAKTAFDMSMAHANERVQFGKAIGKFQAIQHQLSVMAEHVAAARMAAQAAFHSGGPLPHWTACAVAKARASEAAQLVAGIAHAVHGAMGITEEYDLQLYTRRLHEWRMQHGSEQYWQRLLGRHWIASGGAPAVDFARTLV